MEQNNLNNQKSVSDSIKVISMLYDGALNFTKTAKQKLEVGDSTGKSHYIKKTSAIISELSRSLNMDGGEVAQNLSRLYQFVQENLVKAETQNDTEAIDNVTKVIEILRDGWNEMQQAQHRGV